MTNFRNALMSRSLLFPALLVVAAGSLFIALLFGTFPISAVQVFDSVFFPIPGLVQDVIWRLRLAPPQAQLKGMLFWLMGDLSHADHSGAAWLLLALVLLVFTFWSGSLNALALGALKARALGVAVNGLQAALYFGAALATVAAVLLGGSIGFVGLMVPDGPALVGGNDLRPPPLSRERYGRRNSCRSACSPRCSACRCFCSCCRESRDAARRAPDDRC